MTKTIPNGDAKCISLELAKKIEEARKEKGVTLPESEHIWLNSHPKGWYTIRVEDTYPIGGEWKYPAYDCQELGEILPYKIKDALLVVRYYEDNVEVAYEAGGNSYIWWTREETLIETMGQMLLYLITNDLLK